MAALLDRLRQSGAIGGAAASDPGAHRQHGTVAFMDNARSIAAREHRWAEPALAQLNGFAPNMRRVPASIAQVPRPPISGGLTAADPAHAAGGGAAAGHCRCHCQQTVAGAAHVPRLTRCRVVVVSADTGSGKSTQIPQFVLDECVERGRTEGCRIVVTQPRRISAVSLAGRVAAERGERVGLSIGYQVRMDAAVPEWPAHVMFVTTGILIRFLHHDLDLAGVTHVFLDEVHERTIETDVCMILLRQLLHTCDPRVLAMASLADRRTDMKVVLMSATLQAEALVAFFAELCVLVLQRPRSLQRSDPALMQVEGRSYPVTQVFVEELLAAEPRLKLPAYGGSAAGDDKVSQHAGSVPITPAQDMTDEDDVFATGLSRMELQSIISLLEFIESTVVCWTYSSAALVTPAQGRTNSGAILVFVTGWSDMQQLLAMMRCAASTTPHRSNVGRAHPLLGRPHFHIKLLHSHLTVQEQQEALAVASPGTRKIVLVRQSIVDAAANTRLRRPALRSCR